jgi:hypothetical protein
MIEGSSQVKYELASREKGDVIGVGVASRCTAQQADRVAGVDAGHLFLLGLVEACLLSASSRHRRGLAESQSCPGHREHCPEPDGPARPWARARSRPVRGSVEQQTSGALAAGLAVHRGRATVMVIDLALGERGQLSVAAGEGIAIAPPVAAEPDTLDRS